MRMANLNSSTRTVLQTLRQKLGETEEDARQDWIELFAGLDALWAPYRQAPEPSLDPERIGIGSDGMLVSCPCSHQLLYCEAFVARMREMGFETVAPHRKDWEWAFIAQALEERGMLVPGKRGIGFAVGKESLPSYFGAKGCEILATDLDYERASAAGWVDSNQHARTLAQINARGLMSDEDFRRRVSFRHVDMTDLPADLGTFDFMWSSCAFEHLGGIPKGKAFILKSFEHLAPGGVSVHTTEYNLDSDWVTVGLGGSVLFRRADLEELAEEIRRRGGIVRLDFREGDHPHDIHVDLPPYPQKVHLRLQLSGYRSTSFGLLIEKPPA